MSNSIIEAQQELEWCIREEIDKCKRDAHYFYLNYWTVNGVPPIYFDTDKAILDRIAEYTSTLD